MTSTRFYCEEEECLFCEFEEDCYHEAQDIDNKQAGKDEKR